MHPRNSRVPDEISGLAHAGPTVWAAVLWQSIGNTLFG
jgi:O-acetylserine/cysteine efflux transporter